MKSTSYTSSQVLACGACNSEVIICIDATLTISGLPGIDAQVVSVEGSVDSCGRQLYTYGITYEEGQLVDPDSDITNITGIICRGCLTAYFEALIDEIIISTLVSIFPVKNTSVGTDSLNDATVTTGYENSAFGAGALEKTTTGNRNSAIGTQSLGENITGNLNVAIGTDAGRFITGGAVANDGSSSSVYVGAETKASSNTNTNEVVIGANNTGYGSNTAVLGNSSTTTTILRGNIGTGGITAPTAKLHLPAGSAVAGTAPVKMVAGPVLAVAETGTIEFDGANFFMTI
jgi:hypothetical protein